MDKIAQFIENLISSGLKYSPSELDTLKIRFLNIIGFIGLVIFTIYGVINISIGDYFPALFELVTALIILLSLLHLRIYKVIKIASHISIVIVFIFSIYNFLFGGFDSTGILWVYIFPPLAFFLSGKKVGSYYMILLYLCVLLIIVASSLNLIFIPYDTFTLQMFFLTLTVASVLTLNYEIIQEATTNQLKETIIKLQSTSSEVEKSLENNKLFEEKIAESINELEQKNNDLEQQKKAMINLIEDLEEERKLSITRAESLSQFKEAVDNSVQHILFTDIEGSVLYTNKAVFDITGYTSEEVNDKNPSLWGKQMPKKYYEKLWDKIKNKKEIFEGEITNKKKSGELYIAYIQIIPILDTDKNVKFFVGLQRDITRQKEIEKSKNEFVSIASHQLRTPLNAIRWLTEILKNEQEGPLNDKQKDLLDDLNKTNKRMIDLVGDLLNVSRIENNDKFQIIRKENNITNLFTELIEEYQSLILNRKIEILNNLPPELQIKFDRLKITQVIRNILDNAIKYSPDNTQIEIGVSIDSEKELVIFIKDNGYGISDSDKHKIFNKFFRANNARSVNTTGSGLGLYIVKEIMEAHGGNVRFESELNKGTTFFLKFIKD